MLQTIESINNAVNNFIWGVPAMICIIGVGLYLSLRTGFIQIRKFPYALKTTLGRIFKKKEASDGSMTPFQAVCTALAGTVGTGNIAGVAGAIAIGGPGAVFWMWISAILGMCTKFTEVTLAVHFRERNKKGDYVGGPMYYIKNGLSMKWQILAILYSAFGTDRFRYRKCHTGKYNHYCDRHCSDQFQHHSGICIQNAESGSWYCDHASCRYGSAWRYQTNRKCLRKTGSVYGTVVHRSCDRCGCTEF